MSVWEKRGGVLLMCCGYMYAVLSFVYKEG
jgi:hypothetical protein